MLRLVLWDVDHTLIDTRGVGRELFAAAFRAATGRVMEQQARIDGMTDAVIFRETAALHGIHTTGADFDRFARVLGREHERRAGELRERGHALQGAAEALRAVGELPGVLQTVVTGNVRGSARAKLAVFGLDGFIEWNVGAYGEDGEERAELVAAALDRVAQLYGNPLPPSEAVLIGDTPSDIQAARACGVRPVAVATGRSDAAALEGAGAESVLPGLERTGDLLRLLRE